MFRSLLFVVVCVFMALPSGPAKADGLTEQETNRIEAVLDEISVEDAPGVAIGVVRDGEVVLERYIGLADLSNGIPLGPRTRTNIASNAKQYVGLMVLDLADRGQIDLKADFRTYLPDALPGVNTAISVEHLLTHTSGVRDIYDLWALTGITWYENRLRNREAMELLNRQTALNFAPGSAYLYSNSNYILLAEMIEEVSGQRFDRYAREFFVRLGMQQTGWKRRYSAVVPNLARAYGNWNGWLEDPAIANLFGDGFLFTTLRDQIAWEQQLQGAGSELSDTVLAASQVRPNQSLPGQYGFGLEIGEYRGLREISHVGSTGGYNAYLRRFPDRNLSVLVIGNTTEIGVVALGRSLSDAILEDQYPVDSDALLGPANLLERPDNGSVTGRYETNFGTIIRIVERDGELFREIDGRDPVRLLHERGNLFAYESNSDLKMSFDRTESGKKRFNIYFPGQPLTTGTPLPEPVVDAARLRSLEGRYVNSETDTEIVIEWVEGTSFRMIKNGRARDAALVTDEELRWNAYRFRFLRELDGTVKTLLVDNNRIRNVNFARVAAED